MGFQLEPTIRLFHLKERKEERKKGLNKFVRDLELYKRGFLNVVLFQCQDSPERSAVKEWICLKHVNDHIPTVVINSLSADFQTIFRIMFL